MKVCLAIKSLGIMLLIFSNGSASRIVQRLGSLSNRLSSAPSRCSAFRLWYVEVKPARIGPRLATRDNIESKISMRCSVSYISSDG